MAIVRVQRNAAVSTAVNATMPAWSPTPVAGNLLVVIAEGLPALGAYTGPTGYTKFSAGYPFQYGSINNNSFCVYWKIAGAGEGTPSAVTIGSSTTWIVYTYEFSSPTGWTGGIQDAKSSATNTATTTKACGPTGTLGQANNLAMAVAALSAAGTALTFATQSYTVDNPASPDGRLWIGWGETAATTALQTTASWTGSTIAGAAIFQFPTAPSVQPRQLQVVRRTWAGA